MEIAVVPGGFPSDSPRCRPLRRPACPRVDGGALVQRTLGVILDPSSWPRGPSDRLIESLSPLMRGLRRYHRYTVEGLENIPASGAAVLAVHHSLATYDAVLFGYTLITQTGRTLCALGDDKLFVVPGLRRLSRSAGIVPASPENGLSLLAEGHLVAVAPGGMREALRPSSERRQVRWGRRKGFVRMAVEAGVPIIPVACPAADDLFTVYENRLTKLAYKRLKFPVPMARGLGPTVIPRPVRLVTYVGEPIDVKRGEPGDDAVVDAVHAQVMAAITELLAR